MASAEWAHVPPAGGSRRLSVASSSTSLASGNRMLTTVHGSRLDASRRARERQLNSQLLSQISQSPFARSSTTGTLSALSSPTLVSHLATSKLSTALPRTGALGLSGTPQTPRLDGASPLSFGASAGASGLHGVQYPRRRESDGSTYLSYVVGEHKTRLSDVPGEYDDVDLDELAAQAARDQAAATGQPLGDPPASAAPVPSPASQQPTEEATASRLALRLEPDPAAASVGWKSAFAASTASSRTAQDRMASGSHPASASLTDLSTARPSMQPVVKHTVVSDYTNPAIVDQVAKPSSPRRSTSQNVSTSLPPRTPSPTPSEEVREDEIGGQWRKQFGNSNFTSTLEDDDDDPEQQLETRATQNRLDKLRGGPSHASSRSITSNISTRFVPKQNAPSSEQDAVQGDSAGALLRRIQHHFDSNGDGELDEAEVFAMFDVLDEGGTGRVTQQDLRAGLEKAQLVSKAAEQDRSKSPTSDDSRDFRTSARWSGSVNAIERAIPAQFNALREGIDIDDASPLRPSLVRLSATGNRMVEAVEEQVLVAKQVQVRKSRLQLVTASGELEPPRTNSGNSNSSTGSLLQETGVAVSPPASPTAWRTGPSSSGLSLTLSTSGAVRTTSGTSPRTVADEVRAGQRAQQAIHTQQREARRIAEEREEAGRLATRKANRFALERLLS